LGILAVRTVALREKKGWTQGQLALYAKIDQGYLSRIERGVRTNVGAAYLKKLADSLNTSMDYLVGLTDDPRPLPSTEYPLDADVVEIAYRLQQRPRAVRERLTKSFGLQIDATEAAEEEIRKKKETDE